MAKNISLAQPPAVEWPKRQVHGKMRMHGRREAEEEEGGRDAPHLSDARKSTATEKNQKHNMSHVSYVSHIVAENISKVPLLQIPPSALQCSDATKTMQSHLV